MAVRIEGVSEMLRKLDGAPKEMIADVKKAMRSACNTEKTIIKASSPKEARSLVKAKVSGQKSGDIRASVGLFLDFQTIEKGRKGPEWFHMYWKNYGTLQGRDPEHHFDTPIKGGAAARRRRNNVGQRHENFFENAMNGFESRFLSNFESALEKQGYEIGND